MAWLTSFLLGRPGYETAFTVNPGAADIQAQPVAAVNRLLNGDLKKGILKADAPVVRISSNFLTLSQRNTLASLAGITDTLLSFQVRDDLQTVLEYDVSTDTTHVTLQNTSATRLSAALVAAGKASQISVNGVFVNPDGSGPNYYTGAGSGYADATRVVSLASALPGAVTAVYCTYTYKGWLVNLKTFGHRGQAGYVDIFAYDYSLEGA